LSRASSEEESGKKSFTEGDKRRVKSEGMHNVFLEEKTKNYQGVSSPQFIYKSTGITIQTLICSPLKLDKVIINVV
jgi:hypothetical protein